MPFLQMLLQHNESSSEQSGQCRLHDPPHRVNRSKIPSAFHWPISRGICYSRIMKKLFVLISLILATFGSAADEPKPDPILGTWRGFAHNKILICTYDGMFREVSPSGKHAIAGKWELKESTAVERKYVFNWSNGHYTYSLKMNRAGDKLTGDSSTGTELKAERVKDLTP